MNQNPASRSPAPPAEASEVLAAQAQDLADGASAAAPPAMPTAPAATPAPKTIKPSRFAVIAMVLVGITGILLILWAWNLGPFASAMVRTDNAYVRGQITVLAPQVNGYVAEVLVHDFEQVKAGQTLVRIDDRIYKEKVKAAQAQLESAKAQLANASQTQAQNQANLGSRKASLLAVEAEARRAQADLQRADDLAARGSVSLRERDQARATAQLATANVYKARADITIGEQTIQSTTVSRAGLEAQVQAADAQLGLAKIDLSNTVVRAPRDGQLGEASVRLGQYVTAGSQLLFLVPKSLWVVANFKEAQTAEIRVGQSATLEIDALGGLELTGKVQSVSPAAGSEFSVIKPDTGAGNFVKVPQRIAVRIRIDPGQRAAQRLGPGMSVIATVHTGDR